MSGSIHWIPMMTAAALFLPAVLMTSTRGAEGLFPLADNAECWAKMPRAQTGAGQDLPSWARALAGPMPRTTAAVLRLDLAHRRDSPLDPKLRAQMRWVSAHANGCAYAEAVALADARRAGLDDGAIDALRRGDNSARSPEEKAALEFARKMTVDSSGVTDAEFAALVKAYGERKTAAMVLLMAYSNFQDRLLLCLGSPMEPGEPKPALDVEFDPTAFAVRMAMPPPSEASPLPKPTGKDLIEDSADWTSLTYDQLQRRLEQQKQKPTRLRIPAWEDLERGLPSGFMRPSRIVWNQVCLGYEPTLAMPWETLMRTNAGEINKKVDRVFALSVFWIITRAIDCPYCMGHCEMNWEVAGLSPTLIADRSRLLAGDDWSSFPPEEQRALAFARKLTRSPGAISTADIEGLKRDCGPERALCILVYACRCNYMTRISNGFQLSLERDNVFFDYYDDGKGKTKAETSPAVKAR
jgi:alkylhydroperoxidase family enzyme